MRIDPERGALEIFKWDYSRSGSARQRQRFGAPVRGERWIELERRAPVIFKVDYSRSGRTGNVLPTKYSPAAHIPLPDFTFRPELFK